MIGAVKGMNDVRPSAQEAFLDSAVWTFIESKARSVLESYGYRHVVLPIVEDTALFLRGIGEDTDIVSKEMYTFQDRGERSLTLRPEGTAGATRAYVEYGLGKIDAVQRWWYFGPMFRAERPQKGRYRQFYQVGAEFFGVAGPAADAEMILMLVRLCAALGIGGVSVRLNSLGDEASRQAYREVLQGYLRGQQDKLCESCQKRIDTNPLRVLDCKRPSCKEIAAGAPDIIESLSPASAEHFQTVRAILDAAKVPYERDKRLVRGLDYYTGTIFEFTTSALGAQDAILGGGRYDNLVAELGGPPTAAVGFAAGIERLALLVGPRLAENDKALWQGPHLFLAPMPGQEQRCLALAEEIRQTHGDWRLEVDVTGGRLKQQLKRADKLGARFALVLGDNELGQGKAALKDLRRSDLQPEAVSEIVELTGVAISQALTKAFQS